MDMITVNHLAKLYRNGRGVRDLSFTVAEGEVFGYLGLNRAGIIGFKRKGRPF
jgi:ABC-2 type transport system ATP-binding protein